MTLTDRYLQSIRFFLPKKQQDDIIRELSENLAAEFEDRSEQLGRSLSEQEQSEIIVRFGHPVAVAARYYSHRALIGPTLLPLYWFALKLGLAASAIVTFVLFAVMSGLYGDVARRFGEATMSYPGRALMVFAWTTLCFAAFEYFQPRSKGVWKWDPRKLPAMTTSPRVPSRARSVFELVINILGLVWLLRVPAFLAEHHDFIFDLAPVWQDIYWPIILVSLGNVLLLAINVVHPDRTIARSFFRIVLQIANFAIFAFAVRAREIVIIRPGATLPDGQSLTKLLEIVNTSLQVAFLIVCVTSLIEIGREIWRWRNGRGLDSVSTHGCTV